MSKITQIVLLLLFAWNITEAETIINVADYGIKADSKANVTNILHRILQECKEKHEPTTIVFPKGRYDFWPVQKMMGDIGFPVFHQKGITIDGKGSEFIYHGEMEIARVDSSENVCFKNFSVDWDRPFTSQARIAAVSDDYIDLDIDKQQYPYVIERDTLKFEGEGWKKPVLHCYNNLYDKDCHEIVYNTWDDPLGEIFQNKAEMLANGHVRIHANVPMKPEIGTIVVLYHFRYFRNGISLSASKNILLKDLTIYHALSHGVVGVRTENVTMDNCSMTANENKGRVFSIIADASHFVNCKGTILVEHCHHTGQGDDFINVHGRNIRIKEIIDDKTIKVGGDGYVLMPTDTVWLIDQQTVQRGATRIVASRENAPEGCFIVHFTKPLPTSVKVGDIAENKTWNASLVLRNCKILKKHRARGILATTPKPVRIENNYFRTAGTAILIEGDTDYWFESGANTHVSITGNTFDNCLTSGCKTGDRWEWGEAVITITPSHRPESAKTLPYHHNIHIEGNKFNVFDAPLMHARSVGGLTFNKNTITQTSNYKPYTWQKDAFLLEGCRKVCIKDNTFDQKYQTRTIKIQQMVPSDIKIGKKQGLTILGL